MAHRGIKGKSKKAGNNGATKEGTQREIAANLVQPKRSHKGNNGAIEEVTQREMAGNNGATKQHPMRSKRREQVGLGIPLTRA